MCRKSNNASKEQHCLLQLSNIELKRHEENIIFLSNGIATNNKISYSTITKGKNINNKGSRCKGQKKSCYTFMLNLEKISKNYVMICAPLSECKSMMHNLKVITKGELYGHKNTGSGWLLLMLATNTRNNSNKMDEWTNDDFNKIQTVKKNIIDKKNSHHGSGGYYFSFGNNAAYETMCY